MRYRSSLLPDRRQGDSHPATRRVIGLRICGLLVLGVLLLGTNANCPSGKRDVVVRLDTISNTPGHVDQGMAGAIPFTVTSSDLEVPGMAPSIIVDFTVSSPPYPNNTIDFYIMDEANAALFNERKPCTKIYSLENVSGGNPFPSLPFAAGNYVVVFSNYNDPFNVSDISPCLVTFEWWEYK